MKSRLNDKGLLGIRIHNIRDNYRLTDTGGPDPFEYAEVEDDDGYVTSLAGHYPMYDWVTDDDYEYVDAWIEEAAVNAGR